MTKSTVFYVLFDANKWDISNCTQNNCFSQEKSVEEELILYKKHILAAKL